MPGSRHASFPAWFPGLLELIVFALLPAARLEWLRTRVSVPGSGGSQRPLLRGARDGARRP